MKALVIIGDIADSSNSGQQVPYSNGRSLQKWHATSLHPHQEFMLHHHKVS